MRPCASFGIAAVRAILALILLLIAPLLASAQTTINQYDAQDNLVSSFDANGTVTAMTYDGGASQLVVDTEASGTPTTTYYDSANTVVGSYDDSSEVTSTAYDSLANTIYDGDANQMVTQNNYSGSEVTSPIDALGRVTTTVYDPVGNDVIVATEDPLGRTTVTYYDSAGDMVGSFDPVGRVTTTFYDGVGDNIVVAADIGGVNTLTVYDEAGNMLSQVDTPGPVTSGVYDPESNEFGVGIGSFPANSFFDTFADIGGTPITGGPGTYSTMLPGIPTQVAYDSANNTFYVATTPESGSVWLIAAGLLGFAGAGLFRRRFGLSAK